jgi:hypothetical protein
VVPTAPLDAGNRTKIHVCSNMYCSHYSNRVIERWMRNCHVLALQLQEWCVVGWQVHYNMPYAVPAQCPHSLYSRGRQKLDGGRKPSLQAASHPQTDSRFCQVKKKVSSPQNVPRGPTAQRVTRSIALFFLQPRR